MSSNCISVNCFERMTWATYSVVSSEDRSKQQISGSKQEVNKPGGRMESSLQELHSATHAVWRRRRNAAIILRAECSLRQSLFGESVFHRTFRTLTLIDDKKKKTSQASKQTFSKFCLFHKISNAIFFKMLYGNMATVGLSPAFSTHTHTHTHTHTPLVSPSLSQAALSTLLQRETRQQSSVSQRQTMNLKNKKNLQ